jgi:hypothetical protein
LSTAAGLAGNALAIYNGIKQGGLAGYGGAALAAVKGANTIDSLATGSGFLSAGAAAGLGAAGGLLGIYSGIKQGGIMGYGSAALNAMQLYNSVNTLAGAASAGSAGLGSSLAALGPAGLAAGMFVGIGELGQHQQIVTPEDAISASKSNAAGIQTLASDPQNSQWSGALSAEAGAQTALAANYGNMSTAQLNSDAGPDFEGLTAEGGDVDPLSLSVGRRANQS